MSGYSKQQLVEKLAEVGDAVLLCTQVQIREWQQLSRIVMAVHRKTYPDAMIEKTLWIPQLSDFFRKKHDFLVDLEIGKLMSVESSADFLHKGAPLGEMRPVSGELAAMLAFCVDSFDAELILQLSRNSCIRSSWCIGRKVHLYDVQDATRPYFGMVLLVLKD